MINVIIVIYSEYFATTSADFATEIVDFSVKKKIKYDQMFFRTDSCQFDRGAMNE